ncbi:MAG TPA: hypothetical protein VLC53_05885, partial [Myxococcota bacterium]|nr:hypothetical protein [Myxococcota bacterium]
RAARFAGEAFWRELFAIPAQLGAADVQAWLGAAAAPPALARLAERAASRARGEPVDAPLRAAGRRLRVRLDNATGIWCAWSDRAAGSRQTRTAPLAAARRARHDWHFLAVDLGLAPDWQRFFAQLAQAALRRFAYRIPGFAGTSLSHLHANFLAARGRCDEPGRLRLSRPPLHALLDFTGAARGPLAWSGPPRRILVPEYVP